MVSLSSKVEYFCFVCRNGGEIDSAKVGDGLAIHFEIDDLNSPYEIFVRELVASDGVVSE